MSDPGFDPGIDVVVVNYRTPNDLERFVDSYERSVHSMPSDLFIVDVEAADDLKTNHHYTRFDTNVGYSGACNYASMLGDREVVAFFNADTELFDNTLEQCYTALVENSDWGVLGPMQITRNGAITHAGVEGSPGKPRLRGWKSRALHKYRDTFESVTVFGSAYFVKRRCWEELTECPIFRQAYPHVAGAFLPTPHYYEETWCSYHAREHGWKVIYFGESVMYHEWHQASKLNGHVDRVLKPQSQKQFRAMCTLHGMVCD